MPKRPYARSLYGLAKRARPYVKMGMRAISAGRKAYSLYSSYKKKRSGSDNVTTGQFDYRTQYIKKKMPYKKKRRWVRQVKLNRALDIKNAGLKTVLFNTTITRTAASTTGQECLSFALYGVKGSDDSAVIRAGWRDLYKVFKNEPTIPKDANGYPVGGKIFFQSAILDVTLRNSGVVDTEVDVYFGYHYKNPNTADGDLYAAYFGPSAPPINTGNTTLTINNRGVTPFDLSEQTANARFTIKKKQKFYLPAGKSVFIQHRDPKNRCITWESLDEYPQTTTAQTQFAKPWTTYSVLVVFKKVVGVPQEATYEVSAGVTRKYSYSILSQNTDAVALNP